MWSPCNVTWMQLRHKLKVEASGLRPDTGYWYQFPTARTQAPNPRSGALARSPTLRRPRTPLKLAVFSCSNFRSASSTRTASRARPSALTRSSTSGIICRRTRRVRWAGDSRTASSPPCVRTTSGCPSDRSRRTHLAQLPDRQAARSHNARYAELRPRCDGRRVEPRAGGYGRGQAAALDYERQPGATRCRPARSAVPSGGMLDNRSCFPSFCRGIHVSPVIMPLTGSRPSQSISTRGTATKRTVSASWSIFTMRRSTTLLPSPRLARELGFRSRFPE